MSQTKWRIRGPEEASRLPDQVASGLMRGPIPEVPEVFGDGTYRTTSPGSFPAPNSPGGELAEFWLLPVRQYHRRKMKHTAVLLLSTPMRLARKGAVTAIAQLLTAHNGSLLHSDDHLDSGRDLFLSRLEWDLDGFDIPVSEFEETFKPVAERFLIQYHLALTDYRPKIAILVSG